MHALSAGAVATQYAAFWASPAIVPSNKWEGSLGSLSAVAAEVSSQSREQKKKKELRAATQLKPIQMDGQGLLAFGSQPWPPSPRRGATGQGQARRLHSKNEACEKGSEREQTGGGQRAESGVIRRPLAFFR